VIQAYLRNSVSFLDAPLLFGNLKTEADVMCLAIGCWTQYLGLRHTKYKVTTTYVVRTEEIRTKLTFLPTEIKGRVHLGEQGADERTTMKLS
jgi:hypothetical protein